MKINARAGETLDNVSYNIVINAYCKQGLMREASSIFSEMPRSGINPCMITYNTIVAGYANLTLFRDAMDIIDYMKKLECRPNEQTYKSIVNGYCKLGRFQEATDFVYDIRRNDHIFAQELVYKLAACIQERQKSDSSKSVSSSLFERL
eukprot:Gb_11267 [translate_table: standard]